MDPAEFDLKRVRVYDDVADAYQRVSLPRLFAEPGRIRAGRVAPSPGDRVLDAGAGTGAVARACAGHGARVVLADASAGMLREARGSGLDHRVVAMLPWLPFTSESFDAVTSAFVMTHVEDADAAALEMKRVLRRGGRIGLGAWYPADDDAAREWSRVVRTFIDAERVEEAVRVTLPGDGRFARTGSLAELLAAAGFEAVTNQDHRVECAMSADEYVTTREVAATGRALRTLLPAAEWPRVRAAARAALSARFPDGVRFTRAFHTAVGTRAS
jgi:ubiquinone/menaquinone biosynthesis C-methylase UbiE